MASISKQIKVILDTSALIAPFQNKFNIEDAVYTVLGTKPVFLIPRIVIKELEKLITKKTKQAKYAKMAIQLAYHLGEIIPSNEKGYVDMELIKIAKEQQAILLTMDRKLRDTALKNGISTLTGRSGRWLNFEDVSLI